MLDNFGIFYRHGMAQNVLTVSWFQFAFIGKSWRVILTSFDGQFVAKFEIVLAIALLLDRHAHDCLVNSVFMAGRNLFDGNYRNATRDHNSYTWWEIIKDHFKVKRLFYINMAVTGKHDLLIRGCSFISWYKIDPL